MTIEAVQINGARGALTIASDASAMGVGLIIKRAAASRPFVIIIPRGAVRRVRCDSRAYIYRVLCTAATFTSDVNSIFIFFWLGRVVLTQIRPLACH